MDKINALWEQKKILIQHLSGYDLSWIDDDILESKNPRQIAWHILNEQPAKPLCHCGNKLSWNNNNKSYRKVCSKICGGKSEDIKQKRKQTLQRRYGVDCLAHNEDFMNKAYNTKIQRFGKEFQKNIYRKSIKTNLENHDVKHASQVRISEYALKLLNDRKQFMSLCDKFNNHEIARQLEIDPTTVANYRKIHDLEPSKGGKSSSIEFSLIERLGSKTKIEQSNRTIIKPYEIDIWIPDHKLGIEINGDYWHSERFKDKNYHYIKWKKATDNGIQLLQISESLINTQKSKVYNLIDSYLGLKLKGDPARKCQIQQIDARTARPFLDQYHLQGFVAGSSYWGAYDSQDQLVGVMTFGWTRGSKKSRRFELKRWVTDNYSHAGLFSKTFKTAQRKMEFDQVVSFSMNDWFTGDVYEKCGFVKEKQLPPSYQYFYKGQLHHCSNFTKSQIAKKLPHVFAHKLTEKEMMQKADIPRVWDSGKTEWIWRNK